MSEVTEEDDTYGMLPLPSCPVCDDPFKSVLHHINKNEECKSKVTSEQRKVLLKKARNDRLARDKDNRKRKKLEDPQTFRENARRRKQKQREKIRAEKRHLVEKASRKNDIDEEENTEEVAQTTPSNLCPVCECPFKSVLHHLDKFEECKSKVTSNQMEAILEISRQNRLARDKENRKKKQLEDPESFRENANRRKTKQRNRIKEEKEYLEEKKSHMYYWKKEMQEKREHFIKICIWSLQWFTWGRTPPSLIRRFPLVEEDEVYFREELVLTKNESNAWFREIDTALLEAMISMQMVVQIPKSKWLGALQTLEQNQDKKLKDRLFTLIARLQAGGNWNTMGIQVPKTEMKTITKVDWKREIKQAEKIIKLTAEDEIMLIDYIVDILGDENGLIHKEFQDLLGLSDDIKMIYNVLPYTTNKHNP